jgi:hypothetical protein
MAEGVIHQLRGERDRDERDDHERREYQQCGADDNSGCECKDL